MADVHYAVTFVADNEYVPPTDPADAGRRLTTLIIESSRSGTNAETILAMVLVEASTWVSYSMAQQSLRGETERTLKGRLGEWLGVA